MRTRKLAVAAGFAAVWISNHGGRELDHCRGSIEMLEEIVPVVAGRVPVIVDGGFYRGTDVVKALALGATAVANGRIYTMALAADGENGVIETEMKNAMGLLGATTVAQLTPSHVAPSALPRPPRGGAASSKTRIVAITADRNLSSRASRGTTIVGRCVYADVLLCKSPRSATGAVHARVAVPRLRSG